MAGYGLRGEGRFISEGLGSKGLRLGPTREPADYGIAQSTATLNANIPMPIHTVMVMTAGCLPLVGFAQCLVSGASAAATA